MDFDATSLIVGLIVGSVGFVLLIYGKRQSRIPHMLTGILMMAYPYFVSNAILSVAICLVLSGLLYGAVRLGW